MKYLPLIWAGLCRKPTRTTLTLASVVVAFVLIGVLSGIDAAYTHALATARLDRLRVTSQAIETNIPISYANQIARVAGVTMIIPRKMMYGYYQNPRQRLADVAIGEGFFAFHPEITITRQQLHALSQTRTGAVVASVLANKYRWKVGDTIPIHGLNVSQSSGNPVWTFTIVGIVQDSDYPWHPWFISNFEYLDQGRASGKGTVDALLVTIRDPANATQIERKIDDMFANSAVPTRTASERDAAQSNNQSIGDANFFTTVIVGAVLFMLVFVTGNTMTQSIRERTAEFAMLKTIGFTDGTVLYLVIAESVLLCAVAAGIGVLVSKVLVAQGEDYSGYLFQPSWTSTARDIGLALGLALASALFPAWRILQLSIVDALARR